METLQYDVLVIGAGVAGLRAAIAAAEAGAATAVVCKGLLGKAATVLAQAGTAASLANVDARDGWQSHFGDTVRAGERMGDWRMARILAEEAPQAIVDLERWGALFDRTGDGAIGQRAGVGHERARLAGRTQRGGLDLLRALQARAAALGIDVHMECSIEALLVNDSRLAGAFGVRRVDGRFVLFRCLAAVLASGGHARAWHLTSAPAEATGDGVRLALQAGAELVDMEFVQFHPTSVAHPGAAQGMPIGEVVRLLGARLRNARGERFLSAYVAADGRGERKAPELLPAEIVARAIDAETRAGRGTPSSGVWLCVEGRGARGRMKRAGLDDLARRCERLSGIDFLSRPLEVAPACHYAIGGVRVEAETGATRVSGLYAAGEAAGGLHGAGRLAGNALAEGLVFGARAGLHAARYAVAARSAPSVSPVALASHAERLLAPLRREHGESPQRLVSELRECMQAQVGVSRSARSLGQALERLNELRERAARVRVPGPLAYNPAWHAATDLASLLCAAEATVRAALERRETRGCHARLDHPQPDATLGAVKLVLSDAGGGWRLESVPVPEMPGELKRLVDWSRPWLAKRRASASGAATRRAARYGNIG